MSDPEQRQPCCLCCGGGADPAWCVWMTGFVTHHEVEALADAQLHGLGLLCHWDLHRRDGFQGFYLGGWTVSQGQQNHS